MQEQNKYQIERVDHANCNEYHTCCVVDYYPALDSLGQINYTDANFARESKFHKSVGMWKPKKITDKN